MPLIIRHGNRWCSGMIFTSTNRQRCRGEKSRHDQTDKDFGCAEHFVLLSDLLRTSVPNPTRSYRGSAIQVLTACKGIAKRCIAAPSGPFILRRVPERKETKGFVLQSSRFLWEGTQIQLFTFWLHRGAPSQGAGCILAPKCVTYYGRVGPLKGT